MKNRITTILKNDLGAATAEYVVATMAAVGFAGLLLVILKSEQIKQVLFNLVSQALSVPGAGQ
ncbi:MAG: DUF4244 domain-containing protein [Micrococcales bacterium]